jgi:mono/diheme cytochrome c family protein
MLKRSARWAVHAIGIFIGIVIAAGALTAAAVSAVLYSGWFSVAATDDGAPIAAFLLHTGMRRSVQRHARNVTAPELGAPEQVLHGALRYRTSCEACHRAPGVTRPAIATTLSPKPADLSHAAAQWKPRELFWIVKHGVRMSGMPAWQGIYRDDEIWDIVSFVMLLPQMGTAEYQDYQRKAQTQKTTAQQK